MQFFINVSDCFVAPLVRKLWSKDKWKTINQFKARRRFSCYVNNCSQTWQYLWYRFAWLVWDTTPLCHT